jgi:hypothetical protein
MGPRSQRIAVNSVVGYSTALWSRIEPLLADRSACGE